MPDEKFVISADEKPFTDSMLKAALAQKAFVAGTAKATIEARKLENGERQLIVTTKGLTEAGDQLTTVTIKNAKAGQKLNNNSKQLHESFLVRIDDEQKLRLIEEGLAETTAKLNKRHQQALLLNKQFDLDKQNIQKEKARRIEEALAASIAKRIRLEINALRLNKQFDLDKKNRQLEKQRRKEEALGTAILRYNKAVRQAHAEDARRNAQQNKSTKSIKSAKEATDSLTLSWRSFFRLIALRAAAGVIFKIRAELSALAKEYADFSKNVAEIQTIINPAEQGAGSIAAISNSVIQVAVKNNIELADSVNAFYANLSNQVSNNLAGLQQFTLTSVRLSKATVSTLEESGNAISSIVQAYNLSFLDAERVSASLFKTVDEGRLRLTQVADTLGTVGVPAHSLGITFEETNAALARLTLQGITVNRSQTLLRNVFLKLLKPTEKLKDLFHEWGVNSGEAAIQAFGLSGVLQRLFQEAKQGANVLPELFSRIRATLGAQGLAGSQQNVEKFIATLDAVSNAGDQFDKAVKIVQESAGEKFQKVLNETKIIFTSTFGKGAVSLINNLDKALKDAFGESSGIAKGLIKLTAGLTGTTAAVVTMITAVHILNIEIVATTVATFGLTGALRVLALAAITNPIVLIGVAIGSLAFLVADATIKIRDMEIALKEAAEADSARFAEVLSSARVENEKAITKEFREQAKLSAAQTRNLNAQVEEAESQVDSLAKQQANWTKIFDLVVNSKQEYITIGEVERRTNSDMKERLGTLKSEIALQRTALAVSRKRQQDSAFSDEGASFDRSLRGRSDISQINAQAQRSRSLLSRAFNAKDFETGRKFIDESSRLLTQLDQRNFDLFGVSNFEGDFANIQSKRQQFEQLAQQDALRRIKAGESEQAVLEAKVAANIERLRLAELSIKNISDSREAISGYLADDSLTMARQATLVNTQLNQLILTEGEHSKIVGHLRDEFQFQSALAVLERDATERSAREEQILARGRKLDETKTTQQDLRKQQLEGLPEALDEATRKAINLNKRIRLVLPDFLPTSQRIFQVSEASIDSAILLEDKVNALILKFQSTTSISKKDNIFNLIRSLTAGLDGGLDLSGALQLGQVTRGRAEQEQEILNLKVQQVASDEKAKLFNDGTLAGAKAVLEVEKKEVALAKELSDSKRSQQIIDLDKVRTASILKTQEEENLVLAQRATALKAEIAGGPEGAAVSAVTEANGLAEKNVAVEESIEKLPVLAEIQEEVAVQTERTKTALELEIEALQGIADKTPDQLTKLGELVHSQNLLETAVEQTNKAFIRQQNLLNLRTGDVPVQRRAQGGNIFRPQGSDTVPAMLTPGEFVVNAQSAQRHLGLLNRINSGRGSNPQYFQTGGSVSNEFNNSITLETSGNEDIDARRIQRALNRSQRRGVSSPNPRNFG